MLARARTKVSEGGVGPESLTWTHRQSGHSAASFDDSPGSIPPSTILLTGATTGLGLAISRLLLSTPHRVILTGRAASIDRFEKAGIRESPRVRLRALDVTSAQERQAVLEEADASWGGVDVLINNAAVAYRSVIEHAIYEEWQDCLETNFLSPMALIRQVLPSMRAKRAGKILNISSVGGMMAMPTMCLYSASKFALEGATEALWYEVRPWGIHVSLIQPGFINSGSFQRTRYSARGELASQEPTDAYHAHYTAMTGFIARLMTRAWATPEHVATVVVKTMSRHHPPLRVPATFDAHLFALLRRVFPRQLYHALLYRNLPSIKKWGTQPPPGADRPRRPTHPLT